jgi:hypothetical protein
MNIAVCISSRLRSSWRISIPHIINYFKQYDANVDYFVTISDVSLNRYKIWGESYISNIKDQDIEDLKIMLSPKILYVEKNYKDIDNILNKYDNVDQLKKDNYYYIYQLFSSELCNNLKNEYSINNKTDYDLVFKIRPDMILVNTISSNDIINHLNNLEDGIYAYEYTETMMADCFFYGKNNIINKYFKNATDKVVQHFLETNDEIRAEYGYRLLAKLSNVELKSIHNRICGICIRKSATSNMTIDELKRLETNDELGC